MTTLTNNFSKAQDTTVTVAIDAVVSELALIDAKIDAAGKVVPMSLSMKKAQLLSLLKALEARKTKYVYLPANDEKDADKDFAFFAMLIAVLLQKKRQEQVNKLAAKKAPALKVA